MDTNTGVSLAAILSGIVGISLNILVLTYIQKLERIHCPCAEHPYRKWIKGYLVAAIVFIAFNMFVPLYLLKADPAVGIAVGLLLRHLVHLLNEKFHPSQSMIVQLLLSVTKFPLQIQFPLQRGIGGPAYQTVTRQYGSAGKV